MKLAIIAGVVALLIGFGVGYLMWGERAHRAIEEVRAPARLCTAGAGPTLNGRARAAHHDDQLVTPATARRTVVKLGEARQA